PAQRMRPRPGKPLLLPLGLRDRSHPSFGGSDRGFSGGRRPLPGGAGNPRRAPRLATRRGGGRAPPQDGGPWARLPAIPRTPGRLLAPPRLRELPRGARGVARRLRPLPRDQGEPPLRLVARLAGAPARPGARSARAGPG